MLKIDDYNKIKKNLEQNAIDMYNNPELGDEEFESMKMLVLSLRNITLTLRRISLVARLHSKQYTTVTNQVQQLHILQSTTRF